MSDLRKQHEEELRNVRATLYQLLRRENELLVVLATLEQQEKKQET